MGYRSTSSSQRAFERHGRDSPRPRRALRRRARARLPDCRTRRALSHRRAPSPEVSSTNGRSRRDDSVAGDVNLLRGQERHHAKEKTADQHQRGRHYRSRRPALHPTHSHGEREYDAGADDSKQQQHAPRTHEHFGDGAERDEKHHDRDELEHQCPLDELGQLSKRYGVADVPPTCKENQRRGGRRGGRDEEERAQHRRIRPHGPVRHAEQYASVAGEEESQYTADDGDERSESARDDERRPPSHTFFFPGGAQRRQRREQSE